jgi:RimJ/RimL family protein N-acetyltransferase
MDRFRSAAGPADELRNRSAWRGCRGIELEIGSDIERRSAEIGYWLGETYWGKGIATDAVGALTAGYGFKALDLTRVFAVPFASSSTSVRVLEKCGYIREGVMRRSAVKEGVVIDHVLYALTDQDLARTSSEARPSAAV